MGVQLMDWLSRFTQPPWPDAKPLPQHVRDVKLDHKILLHIAGSYKPSANTQVGHVKQ